MKSDPTENRAASDQFVPDEDVVSSVEMIGDAVQVGAIVVLYHPDLSLLKRLLDSLRGQTAVTIVVDNTPDPAPEVTHVMGLDDPQMIYHIMGGNRGVATAQNVGIGMCLENCCTHVLLLDQDSSLPPHFVDQLLAAEAKLLAEGYPVAAVGPLYIDEKNAKPSCAVRHSWFRVERVPIPAASQNPVPTDYLISSGCLIRKASLETVGLMLDSLFIDWVDAEWGFRARNQGLHTYIIPWVLMNHSIGDRVVRVLGRDINVHSPIRDFYIVRNSAYLLTCATMGWKWRSHMTLAIPKHILVHSWLADKRWFSFRLMLYGLLNGIRGRLGEA